MPSVRRGPNTLIFDVEALREFPNAAAAIEETDTRLCDSSRPVGQPKSQSNGIETSDCRLPSDHTQHRTSVTGRRLIFLSTELLSESTVYSFPCEIPDGISLSREVIFGKVVVSQQGRYYP